MPGLPERAWSLSVFLRRSQRYLIIIGAILGWLWLTSGPAGMLKSAQGLIAAAPQLAIQLLFAMFFMIVQFGALMWFMSRPRKYIILPGDAKAHTFADYRGQPDLLDHARSTVRILAGADAFQSSGGYAPKGMLLSGQPGTGKTYLAGIIAAEAGLPFIYIDGSSMRGMFWGTSEMMAYKLFRDARGLARKFAEPGKRGACIIFIDELDSLGASRSGQGQGTGMGGMMMGGGSGVLNVILGQIDGIDAITEDRYWRRILRSLGIIQGAVPPKPALFVIGSTNRPEVLDSALTRPGRLDRLINVYPPDGDGRRDIISYYLSKVVHDQSISVDMMVSDSIGWTPVGIRTAINEALVIAHDAGRDVFTYKDWLDAADQRAMGLKQPIATMSPEDRKALAYHEAGHAVMVWATQPQNRLTKATIIRSGDALGAVSRAQREERYTKHAEEILSDIMVSLGSRAVEEVILQTAMTGASSDLQHATRLAQSYCTSFGMGASLMVTDKNDKMSDALLTEMFERTCAVIVDRLEVVDAVAAALLLKHELIGSELDAVIDGAMAGHNYKVPDLSRPRDLPGAGEDKKDEDGRRD